MADRRRQTGRLLCWLFLVATCTSRAAVALCTKEAGRRQGENAVYVTRQGGSGPRKLHQVWGGMLGNFSAREALVGVARSAQEAAALTDAEKGVTDPEKWADESVATAKASVYSFNGEMIRMVIDTDSHGPSSAPDLPQGYEKAAAAIAKKRAALAGHRLANAIKAALAD